MKEEKNCPNKVYWMGRIYFVLTLLILVPQVLRAQEGWVTSSSGTTRDLVGVYFINPDTGWAVGGTREQPYRGLILKTTDGGENWVKQLDVQDHIFYCVQFLTKTLGWSVGLSGAVYRTTNGGQTWVQQVSGTTEQLFAVHFSTKKKGWAVGTHATIIRTTDGGTSWSTQSNPYNGTRKKFRSVFFADSTIGWVVGHDRIILNTTNSGQTWVQQFYEDVNEDLRSVHFYSKDIGWAFGEKGILVKTINSGKNWSHQTTRTTNDLWGGFFLDDRIGWVVGDLGTVLHTTDGGKYWLTQKTNSTSLFNHVHFSDVSHGTMVGNDGKIMVTSSGGIRYDDPPQFVSKSQTLAIEESMYTYRPLAIDPNGQTVTYTNGKLPHWLSRVDTLIRGLTPVGAADTLFKVYASDGQYQKTLTVNVDVVPKNDPPVIVSETSLWATEGNLFIYHAYAADPDQDPIEYIFENYPAWMSVADSTISGIVPQDILQHQFTLIASDGELADTALVTLNVLSKNDPPEVTSPDSVACREGDLFQYQASGTDPEGHPLAFTFLDYPEWLDPSGSIVSGIVPEGAQDTSFVVRVSDGELNDLQLVKLHVEAVNNPPVFLSPPSASVYEDSWFEYAAWVEDPEGLPVTILFENYPGWMTSDESTISGQSPLIDTPTQTNTFQVIAGDGVQSDTLEVVLTIIRKNRPPRIVNLSDFSFANNQSYAILLDTCVVDEDNPLWSLEWNVSTSNPYINIQLDEKRVVFSSGLWYGIASVDFTVTDPANHSDTRVVNATVTDPTPVDPEDPKMPDAFELYQNIPNPFNPQTTIVYAVPHSSMVLIQVLNVRGERIEVLLNERKEAGIHRIQWNASAHPAGIYLFRMQAGPSVQIKKGILIK